MKKKLIRYFAFFMALNILFEVISPTMALALTNGAVQPEHIGFQQASSSEMVDLFTGDFSYNIPLMDVDGYPLNISYKAGQKMEDEASWVGLGWSLNPGVMGRMMRGLPDDFNGDEIKSETNIKPSTTIGSGLMYRYKHASTASYFGAGVTFDRSFNLGYLMTYNNYEGHSLELQLDLNGSIGVGISAIGFSLLSKNWGQGKSTRLSTKDGGTFADYKSHGSAHLNYPGNWKALKLNSSSETQGTVVNTNSGITRHLYSQSNASTFGWGIDPNGKVNGTSSTHLLPVSSLAFPPRINQSFSSTFSSEDEIKGAYGCIPIWYYFTCDFMQGGGRPRYINTTKLDDPLKTIKSYGYMNLENSDSTSLMDFNRFNEGVYMDEAANGSYASLNNDVFISSAQGMSTSFRAHRSDYGIVHDPTIRSQDNSSSIEHITKGWGLFYYFEHGSSVGHGRSYDGNWDISPAVNSVKFYRPDPTSSRDRFYEKFFFKELGEPTPVDASYDALGGGEGASKPTIVSIGNDAGVSTMAGLGKRSSRVIRNTHISYLSAKDANDRAQVRLIRDFAVNQFGINTSTRELNNYTTKNRQNLNGLSNIDHHLSELTVTKGDGTRYVYGIPVYNHKKKTVIFNASDKELNGTWAQPASNPLQKSNYLKVVQYNPVDVSSANVRGSDNYFHSEETPAYAQSFLLTSIISPDYVDLTGNGPSQDDLGTYILFNYSNTNQYEWRSPYNVKSSSPNEETLSGADKNASLIEGSKWDDQDDKATYEYGIRDNWYLNSIESKNYVAEFEIAQRADNCGVNGEDGALASGTSYKLNQIRLFTKEEKIRAAQTSSTPVPLKTVTFEYDYSLCNGVYNGTSGKLTLKKIYFTHGNSGKMALSPFKFTYADNDHNGTTDSNPDYDPTASDRWGKYKENNTTISNADFPYSEQEQQKADNYAASWNLTSIETPTGAKTDIYYESDDYSYVQDEPTGVMLKIAGFYPSINKTPAFDYSTLSPSAPDIYASPEALVDLEALNMGISTSLSATNANKLVQNNMFPKKKQLYLKCKTYLVGTAQHPDLLTKDCWEYVSCYGTVEAAGIVDKSGTYNTYTNSNGTFYKYAWVRLKGEKIENNAPGIFPGFLGGPALVNPICKAGWEMIRTNFLRLAYPGLIPNNQALTANPKQTHSFLKASIKSQWNDFLAGAVRINSQNKRLLRKGYCSQVNYDESWVRAYAPYKKKIGDGHRVKKVVTRDNWNSTGVGEAYTDYGQEFTYLTQEGSDVISSGVASYEPLVGGDENSMHQPIKFGEPKGFAAHDHYFQETPYLENLYPNAFVGYSKVSVKSIDNAYTNGSTTDKVCQVGKTVYEFYTAKEFPVSERKTIYEKKNDNNDIIDDYMVTSDMYNHQYTAQGFSVKMNDMHGKMKSVMLYGENDLNAPISGTTYYYKANNINGKGGKELVQQVSTINENLVLGTTTIGRNIDVTNDLRYVKNNSSSDGHLYSEMYSFCNLLGKKHFSSDYGNSLTNVLGAASTTKLIQQYGILDRIESFDDKAKSTFQNVLWDYKTGEVVLTKQTNNLDQPVYSFNYPAYWINKEMGHKYERQGINFKIDLSIASPLWSPNGDLNPSTISNVFHLGDEVFIYKEIAGTKVGDRFWITQNPVTTTKWRFMDVNGVILTGGHPDLIGNTQNLIVKIDRPIERNTQSMKAASLNTLQDPLGSVPGSTPPILDKKVLNASALEYCQVWDYFKQFNSNVNSQSGGVLPYGYDNTQMSNPNNPTINPYSANILGCWRPYKIYAYNDSRVYNGTQPNVKNDGIYSSYSPYYQRLSGSWQTIPANDVNYARWVKMGENSVYTPYGDVIEVKDAQGLSQTQRYGFNNTLPILKASNAKMCEVGFDSFEEYGNLYTSYNTNQRIMNDYLGFYAQMNTPVTPNSAKPAASELQAHAGRTSLNFTASQSVVLTHTLDCVMDIEAPPPPPRCDYMGLYKLNRPKYNYQTKYLVSFWVKSKTSSLDYSTDFSFTAQAKDPVNNLTGNATIVQSKTKVVNGWQKFDYEINFPSVSFSQNNQAIFTISSPAGKPGFFMDDFRVQPYNSTLLATVYDPKTLKPWAQLDDQNFATYLEYDNEGALVRGKKETVNGVYTVSETRKNLKK